MKFKLFCSIFVLALMFSACSTDLLDQVNEEDGVNLRKAAVSTIVWKGDTDKAVAVNIAEAPSARKNASGTKITSNAHSADFPGIYFIWDSKQKDNGYLKVATTVFDAYESFTLTSKESNTYWDFVIKIQPGQQKTDDNCYVFFIPKVYNNKNINMVFIDGYVEKTTPTIIDPPIIIEGPCIIEYTIISGANDDAVIVDPRNNFICTGLTDPIKTHWNNLIKANYPDDYEIFTLIEANGKKAQWIWDIPEPWTTGFTGSNIINTVSEFVLKGEIEEETVPFYFACDNAAVLFVNGERVHWTTFALEGKPVPNNATIGFTDFSADAFDGDVWQHLYVVDIKGYLVQGNNKIVIVAANSDENNGRWNVENNPAGLIYACKFTTSKCEPENDDIDPEIEPIYNIIFQANLPLANGTGTWAGKLFGIELIDGESIDWDFVVSEYIRLGYANHVDPATFDYWRTSGQSGSKILDFIPDFPVDINFLIGLEEKILQTSVTIRPYYKETTPIDDPVEPIEVNLGFIGYYMNDGNVLSTSIHWQNLKEGDMIDWDAVDAAYTEWVAGGGLAPKRELWQTSGYASFTFDDYAALGFSDFNIGQLENYYKAYYVDPGYILVPDGDDGDGGDGGNGDGPVGGGNLEDGNNNVFDPGGGNNQGNGNGQGGGNSQGSNGNRPRGNGGGNQQ